LNHYHFPIGFGTVQVSWNDQGRLSHLQWSQGSLAGWYRVKVPDSVSVLIERIRGYFYRGEPIGPIPWSQLDQTGWTSFQAEVYRAIAEIPHGETRTYGWVASQIGKASAARAVGQALRKNPLPILVPCHRVLSSSSMGGFLGATDPSLPELQFKRRLLLLEEEYRNPLFSFLAPGWASHEILANASFSRN
jgi:methylated-DNA-[protein]-cysteine S-methyltransferase